MALELNVVLRDDDRESGGRVFDFDQLQNFFIVGLDFFGERIRTNVNHIYVWVLYAENSSHLGVFLLFKLFDGHPLNFAYAVRIDVNLNSGLRFDCFPGKFELILHLTPYFNGVHLEFSQLFLSLIFELPEPIPPLNNSCLLHQEFELLEVRVCFVEPPGLLYHNRSHSWPSRSFEHLLGVLDNADHLSLVDHAVEHFVLAVPVEVLASVFL